MRALILCLGLCGLAGSLLSQEQGEHRLRLLAAPTFLVDEERHEFKVWLWIMQAEEHKRRDWKDEIWRHAQNNFELARKNPSKYDRLGFLRPSDATNGAIVFTKLLEGKEIIYAILYGVYDDLGNLPPAAWPPKLWSGNVVWDADAKKFYAVAVSSKLYDTTLAITELTHSSITWSELQASLDKAETWLAYLECFPKPTPCLAHIHNKSDISSDGVTLKGCVSEKDSILLAFSGALDGRMVRYDFVTKEWRIVTTNEGAKLTEEKLTPTEAP
jgi:hypothetical protein